MGLFKRKTKSNSWLAIALRTDGIIAASVAPSAAGKRAVALAVFLPGEVGPDDVERAAKELRAPSYRCSTLLAAGEYQLLTVDAPNVPANELKTAVRWRLKDLLDFPPADATIDVLDIPLGAQAGARQRILFVVAARNTVIAARQKLFADAKAGLTAIDIPEMAQRNLAALLEPDGRGLAMLSLDDDGGLFTVTYGGELYLSRRIDIPLANLVDADHDRRHQHFDRIALELQRSLDNFERQFSFISVSKLVLGPSPVTGLDEYLSSNLYTPVETLDLASLFDLERVPELADNAQQQRFFLVLGAALRNEEQPK
ncbi:agglutinin biogenesis protein MshI [Massilia agilis]|uniref:Agglutinin biogenesis protein MshI n=1 Tax=Massilia agilis TaxID=1811226 RepID=A0ABT2D970_9BURK|nr:agglutinin biogenesis protein MshI [Massilia agilis]MCS0807867.1 agglutinin biogenesis protein MshI [Massilia agilis]